MRVYLFAGRGDVNAMSSIVEEYYNLLEAPHREFTWLNGGQFTDVMIHKVEAGTYPHL